MDAIEMRLVPQARAFDVDRPFRVAEVLDCLDEQPPVGAGAGRGGQRCERGDRIGRLAHAVEHALRRGRPDTGQQMQDAKAGDPVARICGEAQQCQHVLDVRSVKEFEAAEFHERNVAAGQLDLQRSAVR
ncbi:hypothetical protein ACVIHD_001553 [Bradyrhizobium embrapense]